MKHNVVDFKKCKSYKIEENFAVPEFEPRKHSTAIQCTPISATVLVDELAANCHNESTYLHIFIYRFLQCRPSVCIDTSKNITVKTIWQQLHACKMMIYFPYFRHRLILYNVHVSHYLHWGRGTTSS